MVDFFDFYLIIENAFVVGLHHNKKKADEFYEAIGSSEIEEVWFILKREPDNPHDPLAVKVTGHWKDIFGGRRSVQLGYVARKIAFQIDQGSDAEKLYGELIDMEPHPEFSYNLTINIYEKPDF